MVRAFDFESDGVRVGVGSEVEVEFEAVVVAVEDRVDAGIDAAVLHRGVVGHIGVPLLRVVAEEVVGLAGELIAAGERGLGCAEKFEVDGVGWEREDGFVAGEEEGVAAGVREELYAVVGLAGVGFEGDGEGGVGFESVGGLGGAWGLAGGGECCEEQEGGGRDAPAGLRDGVVNVGSAAHVSASCALALCAWLEIKGGYWKLMDTVTSTVCPGATATGAGSPFNPSRFLAVNELSAFAVTVTQVGGELDGAHT